MNAVLADILSLSQSTLLVGFVVFLRVGAAMSLLPAFGEQSVPMRVRLGLAVAFTMIVAPAAGPTILHVLESGSQKYFLTETLAGLAIGIVVRLMVIALQVAGSIAAQSTSLSQLFGGASAEPAPAMGHLMVIAGLALAVSTGLHVRLVEMFLQSYDVLPAGQFPNPDSWVNWGVMRVSRGFGLAFALAAPFVIASLIYNVAMGVINKAMPQLMVAFVGAPAITAGGLILLTLTTPYLLSVWLSALNGFLLDPYGAQ